MKEQAVERRSKFSELWELIWGWIKTSRIVLVLIVIVLVIMAMFKFNAISISVGSILLALIGIFYAVYQVELSREVDVLGNIEDIVEEFAKRILRSKKINLCFLAATPAVGASGAPEEVQKLRQLLEGLHSSEKERKRVKGMKWIYYKKDEIENKFYPQHGIDITQTLHTGKTIKKLTEEVINELKILRDQGLTAIKHVDYCRIPMLHFLLINPDSRDRKQRRAILWYLGTPAGEGLICDESSKKEPISNSEIKMMGTGFSTNNEAIIETLYQIFKRLWKATQNECEGNCCD